MATVAYLRPWLVPRELVSSLAFLRVSVPKTCSRCYSAFPSSTSTSTPSRPPSPPSPPATQFSFVTSYAFHGAKKSPRDSPLSREARIPKVHQGIAPTSPIAQWRDNMMAKMPWGAGHDWLFVKEHDNVTFLGVADGVGGWEDSGVDPSHFTQAFMFWCEKAVEEGVKEPREIMWKGFHGVKQEGQVVAGSSTAVIIGLDSNGEMSAANLGDSTFLIIRDGKVIHVQPSQTYFFNAPRQIAKLPPGASRKHALVDTPDDADLFKTDLQDGDVVIAATDGFSDNVWPAETQELVKLLRDTQVSSKLTDQELVDHITTACVNYARLCSVKENKESPFEVEARRYLEIHHGGKVDDVSVVAALVKAK